MIITYAGAEIITETNPLKRIELAGRTCYKSEKKITDTSAEIFVRNIIGRNHTSVLEHARVRIPWDMYNTLCRQAFEEKAVTPPYGFNDRIFENYEGGYTNMNARDFIAIGGSLEQLKTLENADDYMTVRLVTDRGIWAQIRRHRIMPCDDDCDAIEWDDIDDQLSYAQESTRYVNYAKKDMEFILPEPCPWAYAENRKHNTDYEYNYNCWYDSCKNAEIDYKAMIKHGATPEEARTILPNSLRTEIVLTGTLEQWRLFFALRADPAAHPQMQLLCERIRDSHRALVLGLTLNDSEMELK